MAQHGTRAGICGCCTCSGWELVVPTCEQRKQNHMARASRLGSRAYMDFKTGADGSSTK